MTMRPYHELGGTAHGSCYTATTPNCKHGTGWYVTVKFWIFRKRVFVCSDCGRAETVGASQDVPSDAAGQKS